MTSCDEQALPLNSSQSSGTGCISVIIPSWRDDDAAVRLLGRLRSSPHICEIIVSAAEPANGLRERIETLGGVFVQGAKPNRGAQLNIGARFATGDWLLSQHADTELCREHADALAALNGVDVVGGAFYRAFDERHPRLRFLEPLERWHSRTFGTLYGDQSIFVRREHFVRMGGCAEIPLMEDVVLSRRLRRSGRVKLLDPPIRSCPRKQIAQGPWKVTLRNLLFLILFRCGVPVERLHSWYYAFKLERGES